MQNLSGSNELRIEASAAVNGQVLLAALPRIVNHEMVTAAIDFAMANGWRPNEILPPFRCVHTRRGFQLGGEADRKPLPAPADAIAPHTRLQPKVIKVFKDARGGILPKKRAGD